MRVTRVYYEIDDPQDAVVAQMYKSDLQAFNRKAAEWTQNYAKEITLEDKVQHLMEMGFPDDMCRDALERANGDQTVALNYLLQWAAGDVWLKSAVAPLAAAPRLMNKWRYYKTVRARVGPAADLAATELSGSRFALKIETDKSI